MFKSTFSKYLTAFIIIILTCFLILSGIISTIIRNFATETKENTVISTSTSLANIIENENVIDLEKFVYVLSDYVSAIINQDSSLDILVADPSGRVILSSLVNISDKKEERKPAIFGELGIINIEEFEETEEGRGKYYIYRGSLSDPETDKSIVCAKKIVTYGKLRGYIVTLASFADEDALIGITRRTVLQSSAWVLIAAIIATFFITDRIIHPMKSMTAAVKRFAKGDFSARVTVYGHDEVSELGHAFNNMADSLEKLDKMRSSFLASVSHDLRTPMTTIAGFIDGINSGAIPPDKHEYYLGIISSEVHRLSRLVSQLLDVSRLESGDRKFNFISFDVAEMARIILISFEKQIEEKKLDVSFESDTDEMSALGDKDAIHQVIYNLCHNAIKFSVVGGKFCIKVFRGDNQKINVSVFNEGQIISKDDLTMIFERFYKTDKSRGLDKSGVGLGLYISKTIIDAHGETIRVESREGFGTEFSFTLKEGEPLKKKIQDIV